VLVFYPIDETPTCRKQLCEFRDQWALALSKDALVLGLNRAGPEKHASFRSHHQFPFPLLVSCQGAGGEAGSGEAGSGGGFGSRRIGSGYAPWTDEAD
jgi:peroxiredoxin Q/BCP